MTPIEILKDHFAAQKRRRFVVKLAQGGELELFHDPMTLADMIELACAPGRSKLDTYAQVIVSKCYLADGSKAFTLEHLYALRHLVAGDLVLALGEAILDGGPSAKDVGERSGGRSAQPSAPPSTLPPAPELPPPTPLPDPPPYGPDGQPLVL